MSWVVDASVVAKWFFREQGTDRARELLQRGGDLVAPELLLAEVANVAWKRALRGETSADHARAVARALPQVMSFFAPLSSLHGRALELALTLGHSVYDCCYLALAESRGLPLVTADLRLLEKVTEGGWKGTAVALERWAP